MNPLELMVETDPNLWYSEYGILPLDHHYFRLNAVKEGEKFVVLNDGTFHKEEDLKIKYKKEAIKAAKRHERERKKLLEDMKVFGQDLLSVKDTASWNYSNDNKFFISTRGRLVDRLNIDGSDVEEIECVLNRLDKEKIFVESLIHPGFNPDFCLKQVTIYHDSNTVNERVLREVVSFYAENELNYPHHIITLKNKLTEDEARANFDKSQGKKQP